jgi:thiol-disulfide isomerase/thioredoxin
MRHFTLLVGLCASLLLGAAVNAMAQNALQPGAFPNNGSTIYQTPPLPPLVFQDGTGRMVELDDFRGRYVLLNLWATWCGPCAAEMSSLEALQNRFTPDKMIVVAIAEDHDGLSAARYFYMHRGLRGLNLYADPTGQTVSTLHARGLPTSILVDPHGVEVARFEGAVNWTGPRMLNYLQSIIR